MYEETPHVTKEELLLHDIRFRQWQLSSQLEISEWALWRHHSEIKKLAYRSSHEFKFKSFSDRGAWIVRDEES